MTGSRMRRTPFLLLSVALALALTPQSLTLASEQADWRWNKPQDYLKSLHPDRKYKIRVMAGVYRPGDRPMGVGERIRQFRLVADEYETLHPDVTIDFITEAVIPGGAHGEWIRTQLVGGTAPDIINMNTESVWPDIEKGWWVPLDEFLERPNPYVQGNRRWMDIFAYQPLTQAKRAPDKKLYCITYDIIESGIFYNKDIFRKLDLPLPKDWEEFLAIQARLAEAGYVPFLAYLRECAQDWGPDLLFDQCYYEILDEMDYEKGDTLEEEYLQGYLTPKELCWNIERGYFAPDSESFAEVWRLLLQWRQYWQKDLSYTDLLRLFVTERAAMIWDGSWFMRRMNYDPLIQFNWGIFYLPPMTRKTSPYCSGVDQAVIGGSAHQYHISNSALRQEGKLEKVADFLMYITAPENAERIVNEAGMFIPNMHGARMDDRLAPFNEIVKRRYCTTKWIYSLTHKFNDIHLRTVHLYLGGGLSLDELMQEMGRYMQETADAMIQEHRWSYTGPSDATAEKAAARLGVDYLPASLPASGEHRKLDESRATP